MPLRQFESSYCSRQIPIPASKMTPLLTPEEIGIEKWRAERRQKWSSSANLKLYDGGFQALRECGREEESHSKFPDQEAARFCRDGDVNLHVSPFPPSHTN